MILSACLCADALSENFWRMVDCALTQADSLGLGMGIHVCDGFALAGGPWIAPEESMQKVVFCDTVVSGGRHHFLMEKPQHYEHYYEDIAAYAIPISNHKHQTSNIKLQTSPEVTLNSKGVLCADEPCWIQTIERLSALEEIGLGYLTLDRAIGTLSGGEAQRCKIAKYINSPLSDVMYILDEPSVGQNYLRHPL